MWSLTYPEAVLKVLSASEALLAATGDAVELR